MALSNNMTHNILAQQANQWAMQQANTTWFPPTIATTNTVARRRLTVWQKKRIELAKLSRTVNEFFSHVDPEQAIAVMGDHCPVYSGRPKRHVLPLLEMAASPVTGAGVFGYKGTGLGFTLPCLPGRRKTTIRLTMAGVMLLDHWAEKFPSFAPFVTAYLTPKSRKEIMSACFDFEMGAIPAVIQKQQAKAEVLREAILQKELKEKTAELERALRHQQATSWKDRYKAALSPTPTNLVWDPIAQTVTSIPSTGWVDTSVATSSAPTLGSSSSSASSGLLGSVKNLLGGR